MSATRRLRNLLGRSQLVRAARRHLAGARWREQCAALFLVVTGSLGVFVSDEQGQRQMVAHIPGRRDRGRDVADRRLQQSCRATGGAARYRIAAHQPRRLRSADRPPSPGDDEPDADAGEAAEGRQSRPHPQIPAQDLRHRAAAGRPGRSAHRPAPDPGAGRHGLPRRRAGCRRRRPDRGMVQQLRTGP